MNLLSMKYCIPENGYAGDFVAIFNGETIDAPPLSEGNIQTKARQL